MRELAKPFSMHAIVFLLEDWIRHLVNLSSNQIESFLHFFDLI